eukprot:snap_masked-scaffold_121-processed-gene-0.4-mRNA-1 protein AED:1.00 eAED:1.00 QI:0/-1/0/0/-1/1/1/0/270
MSENDYSSEEEDPVLDDFQDMLSKPIIGSIDDAKFSRQDIELALRSQLRYLQDLKEIPATKQIYIKEIQDKMSILCKDLKEYLGYNTMGKSSKKEMGETLQDLVESLVLSERKASEEQQAVNETHTQMRNHSTYRDSYGKNDLVDVPSIYTIKKNSRDHLLEEKTNNPEEWKRILSENSFFAGFQKLILKELLQKEEDIALLDSAEKGFECPILLARVEEGEQGYINSICGHQYSVAGVEHSREKPNINRLCPVGGCDAPFLNHIDLFTV